MQSIIFITLSLHFLVVSTCVECQITDAVKYELQDIIDSYKSQLTQIYMNVVFDLLETVVPSLKAMANEWIDTLIANIADVISGNGDPVDLIEPILYLHTIINEVRKLDLNNIDEYTEMLKDLFAGMQIQNPFGKRHPKAKSMIH
jgi:hypothetical protein